MKMNRIQFQPGLSLNQFFACMGKSSNVNQSLNLLAGRMVSIGIEN